MSRQWTLIFQDVDAEDQQIRDLERVLIAAAAKAGYSLRGTTVEAWLFRSQRNREPMRGPATAVEPEHSYRRGGGSAG